MTSISPRPTFNIATPQDLYRNALAMPYSQAGEFLSSANEGVLSSPGLGTAIRGALTPSGNEAPPVLMGNPIFDAPNYPAALRNAGEQIGRLVTGQQNPSMGKDEYEASPFFRKAIPWDQGMTADRAASLAWQYDQQQARAFMSDKYSWDGPFGWRLPGLPSFAGQFIGGAADPVNYIPVFGEWARAAAIGRWGLEGLAKIGAETGINAAEAAANVAVFGAMSAQQRAQYGDDVSWQAQVNNIAMGALFGAVVTPILHGLGTAVTGGRRVADRIRSTVENVPVTKASRDVLNDAVGNLIRGGDDGLTPQSVATVTRLAADVANKAEASQALARETSALRELSAEPGKMVITPNGSRVAVRPEVVEASSLIAADGALQVRDRSRAASDAQIEEIGRTLDPGRLMPSVEADRGAPIVGPDNVVDSGNGRVAGITRAYEAYPAQAAAYRQAIEAQGFDTKGMQQPVLVQRRVTDLSPEARAQFNAEANTSATARMSASETAAMDRGALDDQTLRQLADGSITSRDNRSFVARFLGNLPMAERTALVDEHGSLNADGQRRIENALVAAAYGDVDAGVLRRFSEATDDNTRSVVGAMSDVAGRWALMRRAMKAGEIEPGLDATVELTNALGSLGRWREAAARENRPVGTVIKEGMGQLDMLDGEMSLEAKTFVRMFYKTDEFIRSAGRDIISARLGRIIDAAEALGRPSLFGDAEAATKLGVLENAIDHEPADLFTSPDAGEGAYGLSTGREGDAARNNSGNNPQGAGGGQGNGLGWEVYSVSDLPSDADGAAPHSIEVMRRQDGSIEALMSDHGIHKVPDVYKNLPAEEAIKETIGAEYTKVERAPHPTGNASIADRMAERFRTAGRPEDEAKAAGALVEAFYSTQAARLGMNVGDLEARFGLPDVNAGGAADVPGALLQSAAPDSPEFKAWFGSSKVVDAEGKPLVVYHATGADFEQFAPTRGVTFLALTPDGAMKGASGGSFDHQHKGPTDRIMPLYVRAEAIEHTQPPQPIVDEIAALPDEITEQRYNELREGRSAEFTGALSYAYGNGSERGGTWFLPKNMSALFKPLQEVVGSGRDWRGRILPGYNTDLRADARMGADLTKRGYDATLVSDESGVALVIADPTQIKSVNNRGTFDPADPRILFQSTAKNAAVDSLDQIGRDAEARGVRLEVDETGDAISLHLIDTTPAGRGQGIGSEFMTRLTAYADSVGKRVELTPDASMGASSRGRLVAFYKRFGFTENRGRRADHSISAGMIRQPTMTLRQPARGAISLGADGAAITLFKNADPSTVLHESSHYFLHMFKSMADADGAPLAMKQDLQAVKEWWAANAEAVAAEAPHEGVTSDDVLAVLRDGTSGDKMKDLAIDVGLQEQWARGFEAYLREGNAPSSTLAGVFEQFKRWLQSVYKAATDLKVQLSPEIRGVFNRLLSDKPGAVAQAMPAPEAKLDFSPPRPEPRAEGIQEADQRVGKGEDFKAIREQYGLADDGSFPEQADLDMFEAHDMLTDEDKAELELADQTVKDASAWGKAIVTAAKCAFGA